LPSHTVQGSRDCYDDPQLAHRGYFVEVSHPTQPGGTTWVEGPRAKLDRTPAVVRDGGPTFGQHNDTVLRGLLGYDDERIADIVIAGALE
jgi:crotonobetainyl-CoA:carnitine CoA-transferase CaiB-like acyl-CoA transferase